MRKKMDFLDSAGDSGDSAICLHRRRARDASVELAAAAALRLAPDYFLASAWASGAVPDSVWRTWTARFRSLQCSPSHAYERALRKHDSGGAGTIPARHARRLGLRPIHRRDQRSMNSKTAAPPLRILQGWVPTTYPSPGRNPNVYVRGSHLSETAIGGAASIPAEPDSSETALSIRSRAAKQKTEPLAFTRA